MENNPELERAEKELENELRIRRELLAQKYSVSDYLIIFAGLFNFLAAIASPFSFIFTLVRMSDGAKIPKIILWLILPAGLASLGIAIALFRVLELTVWRTNPKYKA